ncbi:toxin co-regulated pilus biosynthesis Q family protein [Cupriavidus necator]|uniref:toxin co-regulated pilus biosynthesis Q family protein n=1 Tax=Cupriavidus necator TaxID=106590 RepID=UPI0039C41F1F
MRHSNRIIRITGAVGSLLAGLIIAPAAHASQLASDGWQPLQPTRAGKGVAERALLAANTASPAASGAVDLAGMSGAGVAALTSAQTASGAAVPAAGTFRLIKGVPLQQQLQSWANRAGWTVAWNVPDGWIVPGDKAYGSDFEAAVQLVVEELASNGADVVGDSWRGNRTVIISQNGVVQ